MKYIVVSAGFEWARFSWLEAIEKKHINFVLNIFPSFMKRIWWKMPVHNKLFLKLVIPYITKQLRLTNEPTNLIIYDRTPITSSPELIKELKKQYKQLNVYYLYSDIIKLSGSVQLDILRSLKDTYDGIFTFDPRDALRYQFKYFGLIYSPGITINREHDPQPKYDLFYVGQAKDRYETLIQIYKKAKSENLTCKFFIFGVPKEKQIECDDIIYNSRINYMEVLNYISQSRCLVDAIQQESSGLTIKTCEAVVFDKKLITTNRQVMKENFYYSSNIMLFPNDKNISEFITSDFRNYSETEKYQFSYKRFLSLL